MLENQQNTSLNSGFVPIMAGTAALILVSVLSWVLGPAPWAPYSFVTMVPAFLLGWLATLIPAGGFFLSVYSLRKGNMLLGLYFLTLFFGCLAVSAWHHFIAFDDGVKYQGYSYTAEATGLNASIGVVLLALLGLQLQSPSYKLKFVLSWLFWAWMGWSAFPWFGEFP